MWVIARVCVHCRGAVRVPENQPNDDSTSWVNPEFGNAGSVRTKARNHAYFEAATEMFDVSQPFCPFVFPFRITC